MILSLAFIGALWVSWGKWPDVLIDFGRELYVPWMLIQGKVLYKDILYFHGPLAPYLNAFWFALFGPSFRTIVGINIAILITLIVLLFVTVQRISTSITSFIACFVFITVFSFNQYVGIGNYNYICPYSHEVTYGMLFSLIAVLCIIAHFQTERMMFLAISGIAAGLAFLTKPEFFLAVSTATATSLFFWIFEKRFNRLLLIKAISIYFPALITPPLCAVGLLSIQQSVSQSIIGVLGGWWHIKNSSVSELLFFRTGMGIENPVASLKTIVIAAGVYSAIFTPTVMLSLWIRKRKTAVGVAIIAGATILALSVLFWSDMFWVEACKPLQLMLSTIGIALFVNIVHHGNRRLIPALVLVLFSLGMLAKMFFNNRLYHYGFVLAMPGAMIVIVALFEWIPHYIARRNGQKIIFLTVAILLVGFFSARLFDISVKHYAQKSYVFGSGTDSFKADSRGYFMNEALEWLKKNVKSNETLQVLPDGSILNFSAKIPSSTPIVSTIPSDLLMFGERQMLTLLKQNPPTYIALVHRDDSEYGFRFFGMNYGQSIRNWITVSYTSVCQIGARPFQDNRFGIEIYLHNTSKEKISLLPAESGETLPFDDSLNISR